MEGTDRLLVVSLRGLAGKSGMKSDCGQIKATFLLNKACHIARYLHRTSQALTHSAAIQNIQINSMCIRHIGPARPRSQDHGSTIRISRSGKGEARLFDWG